MLEEGDGWDGEKPLGPSGNLAISTLSVGERLSKDAFLRVRCFGFRLFFGHWCTWCCRRSFDKTVTRVALAVSRVGIAGNCLSCRYIVQGTDLRIFSFLRWLNFANCFQYPFFQRSKPAS